jgi:hypothetical protein
LNDVNSLDQRRQYRVVYCNRGLLESVWQVFVPMARSSQSGAHSFSADATPAVLPADGLPVELPVDENVSCDGVGRERETSHAWVRCVQMRASDWISKRGGLCSTARLEFVFFQLSPSQSFHLSCLPPSCIFPLYCRACLSLRPPSLVYYYMGTSSSCNDRPNSHPTSDKGAQNWNRSLKIHIRTALHTRHSSSFIGLS